MSHYLIELAIWILIAYVLGCLVGWVLRSMSGSGTPAHVAAAGTAPVAAAATAAMPLKPGQRKKPRGVAAARNNKPDDLMLISGVGPKNRDILHGLGVFHFDQIAGWSFEESDWVDDHLKFNGRVHREKWIDQAKLLAAGKMDEFQALFGPGASKNG